MKPIFTIINILLIAMMAYFCVDIFYKNLIPENYILPGDPLIKTPSKDQTQKKQVMHKNHNQTIINRNIFKVQIAEENKSPEKETIDKNELEKLEPTTLNLRLWGTVTGNAEVYAVIEDKKIRRQALYQIGDSIQEAKIKDILRNKVILFYQGKNQVLEMEVDNKKARQSQQISKNASPGSMPPSRVFGNDAMDSKSAIMKQIKFRPHFTEGDPDGLMVYGIRPSSVFRKIGLRNGDIIKDINGESIVSAEDASNLFARIEEEEDAKLTVFRRGKVKELYYQVRDGQYSIADTPEHNESENLLENNESENLPEPKESPDLPEDKDKGDE